MADLLGFEVESPFIYIAVTVVVWIAVFSLISVFFGDGLPGAVIPGFFGGVSFVVFSWYLQKASEQ